MWMILDWLKKEFILVSINFFDEFTVIFWTKLKYSFKFSILFKLHFYCNGLSKKWAENKR